MQNQKRWEVLKELGSGGQGTVYLVRDTTKVESRDTIRDRIRDAVSVIPSTNLPERRKEGADNLIDLILEIQRGDDPKNLGALKKLHDAESAREPDPLRAEKRIRREIEAMANISHPNLLTIIDSDSEANWFVSDYHPNGTLEDRQQCFAGKVPEALRAIRPIVEGVALLHENDIVHRDIKPQNIFFSHTDQPVLGDFGLVFFTDESHTRVSATLSNVGSWAWMPIWAQNVRVDQMRPTFDVFSLGKILWWMVSGLPIQRLPLWYFERDDLNVEELFMRNRNIHLLNPLLSKCVVENEDDCLPNATKLLNGIDTCLKVIDNSGDRIERDIHRTCKACGLGYFQVIKDENDLSAIGVTPVNGRSSRVEQCIRCGYVQVFLKRNDENRTVDFYSP